MVWNIALSNPAKHDLKRLSADNQRRIIAALRRLAATYPQGDIKKLKGLVSQYRLRVGDYRIIFEPLDDSKTLLINQIEKRGDIY